MTSEKEAELTAFVLKDPLFSIIHGLLDILGRTGNDTDVAVSAKRNNLKVTIEGIEGTATVELNLKETIDG